MSWWCGRGDLNYSITLITHNLLILHSPNGTNVPPSRFHCTFIVRRTHCRRENRAEGFFLNPATNRLTSALPIGQGCVSFSGGVTLHSFRELRLLVVCDTASISSNKGFVLQSKTMQNQETRELDILAITHRGPRRPIQTPRACCAIHRRPWHRPAWGCARA